MMHSDGRHMSLEIEEMVYRKHVYRWSGREWFGNERKRYDNDIATGMQNSNIDDYLDSFEKTYPNVPGSSVNSNDNDGYLTDTHSRNQPGKYRNQPVPASKTCKTMKTPVTGSNMKPKGHGHRKDRGRTPDRSAMKSTDEDGYLMDKHSRNQPSKDRHQRATASKAPASKTPYTGYMMPERRAKKPDRERAPDRYSTYISSGNARMKPYNEGWIGSSRTLQGSAII